MLQLQISTTVELGINPPPLTIIQTPLVLFNTTNPQGLNPNTKANVSYGVKLVT